MLINQTNKERFCKLCNENKSIPLFMQSWWMDAVCNYKDWDVLIYEKNNKILGVLVFYYVKKLGFRIILQPQLTQYNGIWIDYPQNQTTKQKLSFDKLIMSEIIRQLDSMKFSFFQQNFHYSITNWQPFYWFGFNQTTRYTYKLKNINNIDDVFDNFHFGKQKHIKKAQRNLQVDFDIEPIEFFNFHCNSLKTKNKSVFYSEDFFLHLYESVMKREQGKIIAIRDDQRNIHSAIFTVWDSKSAYYLISAIDPKYKSSGASSLMVWEALVFLSDKTQEFDFEGSMIEGVAKANEEFGAEQIPYFMIYKINPIIETFLNFRQRFF